MAYYKRLRELREDHDLSQRKLAAYLNLTQTQYFRYEQGYRDLPTDILIRLANLYQTTTDYILELTDESHCTCNTRHQLLISTEAAYVQKEK